MQAVILAAGRGSRLGSMTDSRPKCLTQLAGRPLLEWQLNALRAAGVEDVTVVRGYRAEDLRGEYSRLDNLRWAETNMVASLLVAAPVLRRSATIVSYADIVYHPSIVARLAQQSSDINITFDRDWLELWSGRFEDPLADAESFRLEGDRVIEIGSPVASVDEIEGQYMGLLLITPCGWSAIERHLREMAADDVDRLDMTGLLRQLIGAGVCVRGTGIDGRWCEVDTGEDVAYYERLLASSSKWPHDWRWQEGDATW